MIGCMVPGCPCPHAGVPYRTADPADQYAAVLRAPCPGAGADLRHQDKIGVALTLTERGMSSRQIGVVLAVAERTVCRWRQAARKVES